MNIVFKRSKSGIKNQHLFHNVDFVIFVEGGKKSFTKDEIYNGSFHSETEDIIFWKNVFESFVNGKTLKFKSVGSKTTIKEIAIDIINDDIETVLIAIDNEFDEPFNNRIEHPNIYYTDGYSWENDIWTGDLIKDIIEVLSAVKVTNSEIEQNFSKFIKDLKFAVYADAYLFKKGDSYFKRKSGHLFCVVCNPTYLPSIKKDVLDLRTIEKGVNKGTVYSFGRRYSIDTAKHCFGHLLADYCCQVVVHYLKNNHGLKNLSKDLIYRIALNRFFTKLFKSSKSYNYYEQQFAKNVA